MRYLQIFKKQHNILVKDFDTKKIAHGYVLAGPPFVGQFPFIIEFIKDYYNVSDIFNQSNILVLDELYQKGINTFEEVVKYTNIDQSYRKDKKTDEISVDDIKQILFKISMSSLKENIIIIINNFEKTNVFAVDMLLKALEENNNCVFFFVTSSISRIKNTILSRCKIIKFEKKNDIDILYNLSVDQDIVNLSIGLPYLAEQLKNDDVLHNNLSSLYRSINTIILDKNVVPFINIFQQISPKYYFVLAEYILYHFKEQKCFFDLSIKLSKILKYLESNKIDKKTFLDFINLNIINAIK